jgi:hypothetical protein
MQITVDRDNTYRRTEPTAIGAPLPGMRTPGAVVSIVGNVGRVAGLAAFLPSGWAVRRSYDLDDIAPDDLVLISGATRAGVEAARAALPRRTRIVALLDGAAPAETVAVVLTAGADACVRGDQPAILAGHLVACRRRQTAERWSTHPVAREAGRPVPV